MAHRIVTTAVADVHPHDVTELEREGRTEAALVEVVGWLTGFTPAVVRQHLDDRTTFEGLFAAARLNRAVDQITGSLCG